MCIFVPIPHSGSDDQHAVAVAVKAVALGDRVAVCGEYGRSGSERGDQHDQRRSRQMEVRQKAADRAKLITRQNEEIRFTGAFFKPSVLPCNVFQSTSRCRAHGNNSASLTARGIEPRRRLSRYM